MVGQTLHIVYVELDISYGIPPSPSIPRETHALSPLAHESVG